MATRRDNDKGLSPRGWGSHPNPAVLGRTSRQCSPTSEMGRLGAARGRSAPKCQEGGRGPGPTDLSELGCGRGTVPAGPLCALISSSIKMGRSTRTSQACCSATEWHMGKQSAQALTAHPENVVVPVLPCTHSVESWATHFTSLSLRLILWMK